MSSPLDEVVDGDGFVAVWAHRSVADAAAEETAIGASLVAELAGSAGVAFVDCCFPLVLGWRERGLGDGVVASTVGGLPAGRRAPALTAGELEGCPADGAVHRHAIVTRRHRRLRRRVDGA